MMKARLVTAMLTMGLVTQSPAMARDAPPAPASHGAHWRWRGHGHGMMPMLPGVTLTDAQRAQMHAIFAGGHAEMHDDIARERAIDTRISTALLASGPIDRTAVADLLHQKAEISARRDADWLDRAAKVHDLLTPQQLADARTTRARIDALRDQMHALMHDAADHGDAASDDAGPPPP